MNAPNKFCNLPQWGTFIDRISRDLTYVRIRQESRDPATVIRLEVFFVAHPNRWENVFGLWNLVIESVSSDAAPYPEEVYRWNQIAIEAQMNFRFAPNGQMYFFVEGNHEQSE